MTDEATQSCSVPEMEIVHESNYPDFAQKTAEEQAAIHAQIVKNNARLEQVYCGENTPGKSAANLSKSTTPQTSGISGH